MDTHSFGTDAQVRFNPAAGRFEVQIKRQDGWMPLVDPEEHAAAVRVSHERAERIEQLEAQLDESKRLIKRVANLMADIAVAMREEEP